MAKDQKAQNGKKGGPSTELGSDHMTALGLVGTVALPSPFPATGRIFVVRHPLPPGAAENSRVFHIKIVQKINDSCLVTRLVDHKAVKLIRLQPVREEPATKEGPFSLGQKQIQDLVSGLQWDVKDERASHEIEPHPQHTGIAFVPETEPVLLRAEMSVPAATSLEQIMSPSAKCPHSCARGN
jgi:hypothetical protein